MKTVGIIGFGSFGRFLAEKLTTHLDVLVYSHSGKQSEWSASLELIAKCDYLIPAIPLETYVNTFKTLEPLLAKHTVIVDVCSVKAQPVKIIRSILPDQPLVSTHPLFGPESAAETLEGHVLVICPEDSDTAQVNVIAEFAKKIGLKTIQMTANEHDTEMAVVQGLTFFIAHSLKDLKLHDQKLSTPSFQKLLQLANLEKHHSQELFYTIQSGNKKTEEIRQKFISLVQKLNEDISQKSFK